MICPHCGQTINDDAKFCNLCGKPTNIAAQPMAAPVAAPVSSDQGMNFDFNTNTASVAAVQRYEYKVLSQKDKWFSGKFDPMILEQAMNSYAQQGWRVIGCATADIPGFGGPRQEFLTILERGK